MGSSVHKEGSKTNSSLCCGLRLPDSLMQSMFFRRRSATTAASTGIGGGCTAGTIPTAAANGGGAGESALGGGRSMSSGTAPTNNSSHHPNGKVSYGNGAGSFFGTLFSSASATTKEAFNGQPAVRRSGNQEQQYRKSTLATTTDSVVALAAGATEKTTTVMKAVHNQVAPIATEQPQQMNGINGLAKLATKAARESTPRLDGWSEREIMNWKPTDYEKDLVKQTWSDDFDFLYELGAAIYTYIFEHNPQAKVLFPKIHRHGDKWRESTEFRSQALKFVQTISFTSKNLYHMDEIHPRLFQIGELHVKYASRGFKPEYWNSFLDAMEFALTEHINSIAHFSEQQRVDAARVWRHLAHYIIVHMKRGYKEGEEKLLHGDMTIMQRRQS